MLVALLSRVVLVVTINWCFLGLAWIRYKAGITGIGKYVAAAETTVEELTLESFDETSESDDKN